ncbi:hypothetical protein EYF80_038359 [Liparis tanakae]|uniref:Uncharacterized protein n=1 Tax=Liparis tanakae TaxID=230148 RepID=A0A4Z2GD06_9TELE|nr:hypothetical protein EYF80_038359 [Liparis tanakae]
MMRIGAGEEVPTWLGEKGQQPERPSGQDDAQEDGEMTSSVKRRGHAFNTDGQTAQPMSGLGLMFYLDWLTRLLFTVRDDGSLSDSSRNVAVEVN